MSHDDLLSLDGETLLLSRIVDRRDDLDDWRALDQVAGRDPGVHRRLALLLEDDCGLRAAVDRELSGVDHVGAPVSARRPWFTGMSRAAGWAAALLVAGLWATQGLGDGAAVGPAERDPSRPAVGAPASVAGAVPASSAARGPAVFDGAGVNPRPAAGYALAPSAPGSELLGELAPELVSTRALPDGSGVEVISVRRVLEREVVGSVVTLGRDDLDRHVPVPVPADALLASEIY